MTTFRTDPFHEHVQRARAAKQVHEQSLLALPNVTGVGVGYKIVNGRRTDEVCVRVYVSRKRAPEELDPGDMAPPSINGVATDVIEALFEAQSNGGAATLDDRKKRRNPMAGGVSIGPVISKGAGTLGVWAIDNHTNNPLLLTNWHVLCDVDDCQTGAVVVQPGRFDDGREPEDAVAALLRVGITDQTDAAVARLTGQRPLKRQSLGLGPVSDIGAAALGLTVRKSGRTTGLTKGVIADIDATVAVAGDYPDPIRLVEGLDIFGRRFFNQIVIEGDPPISASGDSGSVWIDDSNWLIGLHFAGSTGRALANPMQTVVDVLNISIGLGVLDMLAIENALE